MDEKNFKLTGPVCSLSAAAADKLIALGDGQAALVYIYLLRAGDSAAAAPGQRALSMSAADFAAAGERLRSAGLVDAAPMGRVFPAQNEPPEYTAEDIVRRGQSDAGFSALVKEAQSALGRVLSTADLKALFGVYDYLGLPADVIMELMNYCVEEHRERYGPGRSPTMRAIEKEAYVWADREIMTFEQAEEHIRARREARDTASRLKRVFGIRDRELTATERRYLDDWLALGFSAEAIEIAFDRTVVGTGALKWSYMNRIIQSWQEKGLHTPEEIQRGDGKRRPAAPKAGDDSDRLRRAYEKLKNGR